MPIPIELTPQEIERFWSKVDRNGSCWEWTKHFNNRGYGRFTVHRPGGQRLQLLAHRVAYALTSGDPGALVVRHKCDNPPCCNPTDLIVGTYRDNNLDALERGRADLTGLQVPHQIRREAALARLRAGRKACLGCRQTKPLSDFYRSSVNVDQRESSCKDCKSAAYRARRLLRQQVNA